MCVWVFLCARGPKQVLRHIYKARPLRIVCARALQMQPARPPLPAKKARCVCVTQSTAPPIKSPHT